MCSPQYRRRGYGQELETFILNRVLAAGELPYCQIFQGNEASLALQAKLGWKLADKYTCWLFPPRNRSVANQTAAAGILPAAAVSLLLWGISFATGGRGLRAYSSSSSSSQSLATASDGIRQSPRGLKATEPTLGPSGRQERLNCWLKNRR